MQYRSKPHYILQRLRDNSTLHFVLLDLDPVEFEFLCLESGSD